MDNSRIKKVGTREEVFKGLAIRTAGGLKKDDIIEKQFGTRVLYISKRLSDKMRENFTFIRNNNPNYLRRQPKKTMTNTSTNNNTIITTTNTNINTSSSQSQPSRRISGSLGGKTHKLSFKTRENTVKNVYYPELQGLNIQQLKEELAREEAEEDRGIQLSTPKKEFSIEEMPEIDIFNLH